MLDAADLSGDGADGLRQAAEYLHDILLALQKRSAGGSPSKRARPLPLLVAANKLDLFTALPASLVRTALEAEISKVRRSRNQGLLDSGIGMNELDIGEEKDWLGDGGEGGFGFQQMEELGVSVNVLGGNVLGVDGADVGSWWDWIGERL